MKILKYAPVKKKNKWIRPLRVKVKCRDCGTVILINRISDLIWEPFMSYEGYEGLKCFETDCPYCKSRFLLEYKANKKITKWINKSNYDMKILKRSDDKIFKTIVNRENLITVYTKIREDDNNE